MTEEEQQIIQSCLIETDWLKLVKNLHVCSDNKCRAEITVSTQKETLHFELVLWNSYPNSDAHFILINEDGHVHQMNNSEICLTVPPILNTKKKFLSELEKLQEWIHRFYEREETPTHYERLEIKKTNLKHVIYFDDYTKRLNVNETNYGTFHYTSLQHNRYLVLDIEGIAARWSRRYRKLTATPTQGVWLFIKQPPVLYRRKTIGNWNELLNLLDEQQIRYLYQSKLQLKRLNKHHKLFILLGYMIPDYQHDTEELHWEMIEDHTQLDDDSEYSFVQEKAYKQIRRDELINWQMSRGMSYQHFFGRGRLSDKFIHKNILIIGVGAIGSALAHLLVRGGVTNMTVCDGDHIEPGNICRSTYHMMDLDFKKSESLQLQLEQTSPFIQVDVLPKLKNVRMHTEVFQKQEKQLAKYDVIFDCSTDKYLSFMLDQMNLSGQVINFSISNKAKQFVCVVGNRSIHSQKARIYQQWEEVNEPFYPNTGCYHPTFEASCVDINLVLNFAVKEINSRLEKDLPFQTFIIETNDENASVELKLSYDSL